MNIIKVTDEGLKVGEIYEQVVAESTGAVSLFVGTTRDHFEQKKVVKLEYEAYVPMAEKEIEKICQQIREKWKVEHIAIYHRLGQVATKEASVVIAVSSEHRNESLDAVRFAIEELKSKVPIWKKELYDEGDGQWKVNKECQWNKESKNEKRSRNEAHTMRYDENLVQIKATNNELERRISAFMDRKRQQADTVNIQEFCHRLVMGNRDELLEEAFDSGKTSCARTDAVFVCRKDSKSHLRVSQVVNSCGPQTRPEPETLHLIRGSNGEQIPTTQYQFSGIEERLRNLEDHLNVSRPVATNIYQRLKLLEDKVLYLESVSPEYFHTQVVTTESIERRMDDLRRKLTSLS